MHMLRAAVPPRALLRATVALCVCVRSFERDMTTLEAQQDLYFITFAALLNISVLRSAQPMVAKKGLLVLLGTSTLLYNRVATAK